MSAPTASTAIHGGTTARPEVAAPQSLRRRAMRASVWIIAGQPVGMAVQLARSVILTRLLFPDAFGVMALVAVVMQGLQMCSDIGIGPSIIKSQRGADESFLQTAWTLGIIRGCSLWLICCALAWPAAVFYRESMLLALLPVAGLNIVIASFHTTAWAAHDRTMSRGRMTIIGYAAALLNLIVMILVAWWMRSVWALVIGGLSGNVIAVALGHCLLPGIRHRLHWDKAAVHEVVRFGKWVFLSTLLTFFAMQLDKLMLGKLIPMGLLGVYSIALVLANLPRELVQGLVSLVLFPVLAEKLREDPARMRDRLNRARGILLRVGLLLCVGVVAIAPVFFHYLYDARYAAASWMAQLLALSAWITVLNATTGSCLLAFGDSKSLAAANFANAAVTFVAALVGFRLLGMLGFIIGYAAGTAAGEVVQGLRIRRFGVGVLRQDLALTMLGLTACAAYLGMLRWLSPDSAGPAALLGTSVGIAVWGILAGFLVPPIKRELAPRLRLPWQRRGV